MVLDPEKARSPKPLSALSILQVLEDFWLGYRQFYISKSWVIYIKFSESLKLELTYLPMAEERKDSSLDSAFSSEDSFWGATDLAFLNADTGLYA